MSFTTVLFDLDGTLLPMDQDLFTKHYFKGLCVKMAPYGYDPDGLIAAIWSGTKAMIMNDGSRTGEAAFWDRFASLLGEDVREREPDFADFYANEFQAVQKTCGFNPEAGRIVRDLKAAGYRVVLATNPLFPAIATESRVRWAGLDPADFELVTTYDNSSFCKPNPAYYQEILDKIGATAEECIMVGNDVKEDMVAASKLGMRTFLLTDCLLNNDELDTSGYPQGGFAELRAYLGL
ncbi:MAG: HAD family hydrolase [Clostridia bacterium]|nr:HAD family hydrolase [Clostridia bacterium]